MLIIQGSSSQDEEIKILEFIKEGGRIVLFPDFDDNDKAYKCISKMESH